MTRDKNRKTIYLHRLITDAPNGMDVDHINGDTLDNLDSNLRVVTHLANMNNIGARSNSKSGIRGVCWIKRNKAWKAYYREKCIGFFPTKEAAAEAVKDYRESLSA